MKKFVIVAVILSICLLTNNASAVIIIPVPAIHFSWSGGGGGSWDSGYTWEDIVDNGDGTFDLDDTWTNDWCDGWWSITYDSDPYVVAAISMTNTSTMTQNFILTITTPVSPPITPTSLHGGDVSGSFTTDPSGGTLSTVSPAPLYLGMIDGTYHFPRYFGMIMVAGITLLVAGRVYCGYCCPIGVIQELCYEVHHQ